MAKYKKRLSSKERWAIIKPIIEKSRSINQVSKYTKIDCSVIKDWVRKYNASGIAGLENVKSWKPYSAELKYSAVNEFLVNNLSKSEIIRIYEISSRSVLTAWINIHNSENELLATSSGKVGVIVGWVEERLL